MNKVNNNKFKSNGVLLKKNFFNSATPYKNHIDVLFIKR